MELIVISDLHLSVGYDEKTGRYSRNEDFFFDEEFKRFLEYLQKAKSPKKHLIIAGDLFDFLQVDGRKTKELDEKGGAPFEITPKELKFGLGTEEDKTVWKLGVIADGHPVFFQALANFLSKGNRLSITTGNHDIELYWEKVKKELVNRIIEFKNSQVTNQQIEDRIDFYPWFYYDKDYKTYIEHGNQYDTLNSFQYFLYPLLGPESDKLLLPVGSFFVRYFFNKLEASNPFADNIKPPTKYMRWAWKEDKLQFLKTILRYLPTMWDVYKKGGNLSGDDKKYLEKQNEEELGKLPDKLEIDQKQLEGVNNIYSLMTPPFTSKKLQIILHFAGTIFFILTPIVFIVFFVLSRVSDFPFWMVLSSLGLLTVPIAKWAYSKFFKKDRLKKVLPEIKEHLKNVGIDVQTIVFGHTHDPDIRIVAPDCMYFNTGTWTTVFSQEERIIREAKQFAFVWIKKEKDGTPQATLFRWNDCLKRHEKLILFEKMAES